VISLQDLADALADAVSQTGELAPAILFLATLVEYVFPPFPGDLVVVLGAWYAVHGELSWPATFVSVTSGALAGAWVDYRIGARLGRRLDRRAAQRSPELEARLARFEASYRRWGVALLLLNRFLPGIRAFIFVAAGASGIPLRKVLLAGAVSAALWNALLLAAGATLAENVDDLVRLFERYTRVAWVVVAVGGLAAVAVLLLRRRRRRVAARAAGERA
jgi:membrane protein DedA with SNARE-associated domain